jgi:hypothetical protein
MSSLFEILVPTIRSNGKPIRTRCHKAWDSKVRDIAGGLTIMSPVKGEWVYEGDVYRERVIPVRIMCNSEQISQIVKFSLSHYDQLAIMYYEITNNVIIVKALQ